MQKENEDPPLTNQRQHERRPIRDLKEQPNVGDEDEDHGRAAEQVEGPAVRRRHGCPSGALHSPARAVPTGSCSGSQPCFVAVFQICPASPSPSAGAPLDEYVCTCDGASWQCSLNSQGAGVCAPYDARSVVEGGE